MTRLGDGRDACQHDIAEARGEQAVRGLSGSGQDLFGIERIAARPLHRPLDQPRIRDATRPVGDESGQFIAVEPGQVDPIDPPAALQLREVHPEGVPRVGFVGPDGRDEEDRLVVEIPDEEGQEIAARWVGPVEVLDHEDHGRRSRESNEDAEDKLEEATLREAVVAADVGAEGARGPASIRSGLPRISGMSLASSPRFGPSRAGSAPGSNPRTSARSASTNGAYGNPPVPSERQPPRRTRAAEPVIRPAKASTSRLLPMPASPAMTTSVDWPDVARANASASRSSSAVRPMNVWPRAPSTTRR